MELDWSIVGGFLCGALAGGGARFGRVCSMSAIEDALVARDFRGAKAWGLAAGVAGLATMALVALGLVELGSSAVLSPRLHLLGTVLGGVLFGLGMTLVGTCSFGLVVRAGGGDLRAFVSMLVVGAFAFAFTAGMLAPVRTALLAVGAVDLGAWGGASLDALLGGALGLHGARAVLAALFASLIGLALVDRRVRQRRRLVAGGAAMGLAVAAGWLATSAAVAAMTTSRVESLSFVAPAGRALLQFMMVPFREANFGMVAISGAGLASLAVAAWKQELRWEAFDDAREMRRHLTGAALMGIGGVLAQGCTVGQGLTAASALAVSAPVFVVSLLVGAHLGLRVLIEGTSLWRLGFSTRAD